MSELSNVFAVLPGLEVPVAEIPATLSAIWDVSSDDPSVNPAEFRATQMNLILHLGLGTSREEADEVFHIALRFARRYPARIIVLCPCDRADEEVLMTSKLFSECYVGKTGRDRSCCEAIILAYPAEGRNFLEDQVSILLEADLPTYYWQHRFQVTRRLTDYRFFLDVAKRVVYDSRREGPEIREVKWPKPSIVRDLADSSLLPIRQGIGQFLSGFDPKELAVGLRSVRVSCSKETEAEAVILCDWVREAMEKCARIAECPMEAEFRCCPIDQAEGFALEIHFSYDDDRYFHWKADWKTKIAEIDADFGRGRMQLPTTLKTFDPETALAEALFF